LICKGDRKGSTATCRGCSKVCTREIQHGDVMGFCQTIGHRGIRRSQRDAVDSYCSVDVVWVGSHSDSTITKLPDPVIWRVGGKVREGHELSDTDSRVIGSKINCNVIPHINQIALDLGVTAKSIRCYKGNSVCPCLLVKVGGVLISGCRTITKVPCP